MFQIIFSNSQNDNLAHKSYGGCMSVIGTATEDQNIKAMFDLYGQKQTLKNDQNMVIFDIYISQGRRNVKNNHST